MTEYYVLKFLHVIGATVLLGTGAGIAFFMLLAHRTGDTRLIAGVARIVVIAGTILLPQLWRDPLGPMMKIWPILVFNFICLAILDER